MNNIYNNMDEETLIKTIDNFLIFCGEDIKGLNIKDKKKLLKKYKSGLETDIYISEIYLEKTYDKDEINELKKRIIADKQVIKEINEVISYFPTKRINFFKKKWYYE